MTHPSWPSNDYCIGADEECSKGRRVLIGLGCTSLQMLAADWLRKHPRLLLTDLAKRLGTSKSGARRVVKSLRRKGIVTPRR